MKAEELMIGDWVAFRGHPYQYTAQDIATMAECEAKGIDTDTTPIPLTPEILEQNGFVKSERYEVWKIIHNDYEMRITPWRFAVIFLEDVADKEEFSIPRPNFVHELQHALRLCGIEKEVVL